MNFIEVFRGIIPHNKLINDNYEQHYKIMTGKMQWLTNKAKHAVEGVKGPGNFISPTKEEVASIINGDNFGLILEHWKCQRKFDLANYEMTFKPIIDVFSNSGYWKDDAWRYLHPVVLEGGDYSVWDERALRYKGDGLPNNIKKSWWTDLGANPNKDSFIRVIAFDNKGAMNRLLGR